MNFHKNKINKISLIFVIISTLVLVSFAQNETKTNEQSTVVFDGGVERSMPIALGNNLYCAGYIQSSNVDTNLEIVGATQEKDKHIYAEGDHLYINSGASNGVKVGDMFSVIRPRGKVKTKWTKKNSLGTYVQELGAVEVIRVMNDVSVARVTTSCGVILFGDLLNRVPNRQSPMFVKRPALELYSMSSGKANGRIVMARDNAELLGGEQIVYVDLGREDNIQVGDYMTVYRPLGTGNIYTKDVKTSINNKEVGNQSERYKGGDFSNQATRKKGENSNGELVTSEDAKSRRLNELRRVVGELVILNVLEKTATAVIIRNASEIHTGDQVELQ